MPSQHFERCSKYEKVVENRVKEIILLRGSGDDEPPVGKRISERNKKMQARERGKRRTVLEERDNLKKSKRGKSRKRTALITSPEIITAEEDYFRIVKEVKCKTALEGSSIEINRTLFVQFSLSLFLSLLVA